MTDGPQDGRKRRRKGVRAVLLFAVAVVSLVWVRYVLRWRAELRAAVEIRELGGTLRDELSCPALPRLRGIPLPTRVSSVNLAFV